MRPAACEDRGADLFLLARDGGEPGAELLRHVASCASCRGDLGELRQLVRRLPEATGSLLPRPSTREALIRAVAAAGAPPLPARLLPGPVATFWIPVGALAASVAILVFAVSHSVRRVASPAAGVQVRTVFGGPALEGLGGVSAEAGKLLSASATASVHLGDPLSVEVVLGKDSRLGLPPSLMQGGAIRSLDLLAGAAYFEPGPAPGAGPLRVRAGGAEVEDRGARFAVERRAGGAVAVIVETGVVVVRSAGAERAISGPCRVDLAEGAGPPEPSPAEAQDATAWFAFPELALEVAPPSAGAPPEILLTLRPSVPRPIRVAPFHRFDPLFTLRAIHPGRGLVEIPLRPGMLVRPAPEADADGAFLLRPDRPYRVAVDPGALGLEPGTWRLEALYASGRVGGLWRGTRASNPVDLVVR